MPVVLSDNIEFPFNGGRGLLSQQMAGGIVTAIDRNAASGMYTATFRDPTTNMVDTLNFRSGAVVSANAPASPHTGQEWWDSTNDQFKVYNGTEFVNAADGGNAIALRSAILGDADDAESYSLKSYLGDVFSAHPTQVGHTVAWQEYGLRSDVSALWGAVAGTYRWRGVRKITQGVSNAQDGDIIMTPGGGFRRIHNNSLIGFTHPDDWIGSWEDEATAENHVTALDQVAEYNNHLWAVTTYVAGTITKAWEPFDPHITDTGPDELHEQTLVNTLQALLRDSRVIDERTSRTPVNAGFALFSADPSDADLVGATYGTASHEYTDLDIDSNIVAWEIPVAEDVRNFWQSITIDSVARVIEGALFNLAHSTTTDNYYTFKGVYVLDTAATAMHQATEATAGPSVASREKLDPRYQYLGANLHGDISDPDNPLDLNHEDVLQDDKIKFDYNNNQTLHSRLFSGLRLDGHITTIGDEDLYFTELEYYLFPNIATHYRGVVAALSATDEILSIHMSTTAHSGLPLHADRHYYWYWSGGGIKLEANGRYFIGVIQSGGYAAGYLNNLYAAGPVVPVVTPSGPANDDDIAIVSGARYEDPNDSNAWRPPDAVGQTLTPETDLDRIYARPRFHFHKTLTSVFVNPPEFNLSLGGAEVETGDPNNRVKRLNLSDDFTAPDSTGDTVNVGLAVGGATAGTPVTLADSVALTVSIANEITLAEELKPGALLSIFLGDITNATVAGYALVLSDDLLSKPVQAAAPTTLAGSFSARFARPGQPIGSTSATNVHLWFKDSTHIYARNGRAEATDLTIIQTPRSGIDTSQSSVGAGLEKTQLVTSNLNLVEYGLSTALESLTSTFWTFPAIDPDILDRFEIGLNIAGRYTDPIIITNSMYTEIGAGPASLFASGLSDTRRLDCIYWGGRPSAVRDAEQGHIMVRPEYAHVNSRRLNESHGLFIVFDTDADDHIRSITFYASSTQEMVIEYIDSYTGAE